MFEALEDPGHESHAETLKWLGDDFDPHAFDAEQLKADVAALKPVLVQFAHYVLAPIRRV
jgi:hypothetical protein